MRMVALILAGGQSQRLWPVRAKQFVQLMGNGSLLQQTVARLHGLLPSEDIWVLTNESQVDQAYAQLPQLPRGNFIAEPSGRSTAAAITLGVGIVAQRLGDPLVLALPSDHFVEPKEKLHKLLQTAATRAWSGGLCIFGVKPRYPATGYGYIRVGSLEAVGEVQFSKVLSFQEKPGPDQAREFLARGDYWNSGILMGRAQTLMQEIQRYLPLHAQRLFPLASHWPCGAREGYLDLPHLSIDRGVLERSQEVFMATTDLDWDDLGSWESLRQHLSQDEKGNALAGRVHLQDSHGNLVFAQGEVTLVGVENLVVVEWEGRTLIVPKDRLDEVRGLVTD